MKVKKQGRSYIIQDYEDMDSLVLNRKKTDKVLNTIEKSLQVISKAVADLYDDDAELYWFIHDHIWLPDSYYLCDGKIPDILSDVYRSIVDLQDYLKEHNDEIKPREETICLEELGFKDYLFYHKPDEAHLFERRKSLEGNTETTEEIVFNEGNISRRLRTIIWEETMHGKSSRSIKYQKLPMTKQLQKAAENTLQQMKKKRGNNG